MYTNKFKRKQFVGYKEIYSPTNPFEIINKYPVYKEVWDMKKIMTIGGVATVIVAMLSTMTLLAFRGGSDAGASTDVMDTTTTTQVETTTTTTTTTTTVPVRGQYVCDMPKSYSTEYTLLKWDNGKVAYPDFPSVTASTIVFEWHIDQVQKVMDDFRKDIEEVGRYVGKEMRIELPGYVAQDGEFVVPVVFNKKKIGTNDYSAYIMWTSNFFFGVEATFAFNPDVFSEIEKWNADHHIIVLHELGHLFGLDHTHIDDDGITQDDSIMSYEDIWNREGYMPGDIAGLQHIFCNN